MSPRTVGVAVKLQNPPRLPTDGLGVASLGDAIVPLPEVEHTRDAGL
jgi:hypothetical protein